eukprot:Ihof_evm1s1045 gene=Ihof_evmTU1s1045
MPRHSSQRRLSEHVGDRLVRLREKERVCVLVCMRERKKKKETGRSYRENSPDLPPLDWSVPDTKKQAHQSVFMPWSYYSKYGLANDSLSWGCIPASELFSSDTTVIPMVTHGQHKRKRMSLDNTVVARVEEEMEERDKVEEVARMDKKKGNKKLKVVASEEQTTERKENDISNVENETLIAQHDVSMLDFELDRRQERGRGNPSPDYTDSAAIGVPVAAATTEDIDTTGHSVAVETESDGSFHDLGLDLTPSPATPIRDKRNAMRLSHVLMGPSFIPSDVSMETVYDAATDGIQSVVAIETMSTIKTNAVHVREGQENIQVGRIEGEEEREREREKCMVDEGVGMLEDQKEVAIQKAMATQLDLNGHGNVIVHTEVFTANAEKGMKSKVDISDVQVERVEKEMEKEKDKEKDHEKDKPLHTIDTPRRTSSSRIDPPRVAIKGGIHSSMLNGKIEETKPPTHPLTPLELQREHERKVNEFWCSRHQLKHMLDQKVHHAGRITGLLAQERQRLMELQQQKESMSGVLAPKHQQELDELSMRVANEQAEYLQAEKDFATVHAGYYHSMHPSASSMID